MLLFFTNRKYYTCLQIYFLDQQKHYDSLYCNIHLLAVVTNRTRNISEVGLY